LRVTHRMLAQTVTRNLRHNLRSMQKQSAQLSSGRMFTRPSQDPVGTYKVMRISGTGLMRNEQYQRNIGEGITWLTITEDALAEAVEAVQRLRELALGAANGTLADEDLEAISSEVKQILESLVGIGNTELTGLYIFGGHQTQDPPFQYNGNNVSYQGDLVDEGQRIIEITPQQTLPINLTGVEVFGEDGTALFETVIDMYDALTGTPPDQGALGGDILQQIDAHLERLLQCRAEVGARSDRLTSTEQRLKNEHIYLRELRSKIEDIDMAELITEFTMQQNAYYAALSTGASMIYPSLVDFLR
jgi:flagellar hook-associated protein 3 FlgL